MKSDFEHLIIGLGGLGSAAAYWLSRRAGSEVLGLEQFELGHIHGESQDHSRIIRLSYHTPQYVRLAQQAYAAWAELERDADEKLIVKAGGLDLWPENPAIPMSDYTQSLQACEIPYEILNADEIRKRFPQFSVTSDVIGMYQADAGIAPAAKCNAAHQRLARRNGAELIEHAGIQSLRKQSDGFEIQCAGATYRCKNLIIAAGPWSNSILADFDLRLPLTITQEQVTYFSTPHLPEFMLDRFPIWIWMDDPSFYGFPVYGEQAVKVGQDVGGVEVTPETRTYETDHAALERVEKFLKRYIPHALGPILYTKTCLYTLTPDRDFVIDELPGVRNCFVTIGAGHAFKFASLIGKILSELAIDGTTASDISKFKIDRPILLEKNPPKNFMT